MDDCCSTTVRWPPTSSDRQ
ncbi:hypothetical protein A2U01_0052685, partial [Trifolium medium]|nr:hypothetical protein [Trifolium medium]